MRMKRLTPLLLALLSTTAAYGADNAVVITPGSGVTMKSKDIGSGVQAMQQLVCDPTTPAQCIAVDSSGRITAINGGGTVILGTSSATIGTETNSSALLAAVQAAIPAGTNTIGYVLPGNTANTTPWLFQSQAGTTGGATPFHLVAANSQNASVVKASAGIVYAYQTSNNSATPAYLKFYDTASSPTCSSTTVKKTVIIPANSSSLGGGNNAAIAVGVGFSSGIAICVTGGLADNDTSSVAAANTVVVNIDYK